MIAAGLFDWFTRFPALWAVTGLIIGTIVTGFISWSIWRQFGPALTSASDKLVDLQKKQLDTMQATLEMQKKHYEDEAAETRRKYEADIAEAKLRADRYEKSLHDKRNEWNAEKLEMTTQIEGLKNRPDVTTLFEFESKANERREEFYKQLSETMRSISDSLSNHDQGVEKKVEPMMEALTELVTQSKKHSKVLGLILREQREQRKKAA